MHKDKKASITIQSEFDLFIIWSNPSDEWLKIKSHPSSIRLE